MNETNANEAVTDVNKTFPARNKRVTAADVAAKAGVSRSAVSRAFTKGAYLDDQKKETIIKAAQELGYRPNALAAGLQGTQSHLVAILAGDMRTAYDAEMVAQLVSRLNAIQKWPIILDGGDLSTGEAVRSVLGFPLDAMILRSGSMEQSIVEDCAKLNIPMISSGYIINAPGVDNVCCKNADGIALAVSHVVASGRKRIVFLGGPAKLASSKEREAGFDQAMSDAGLTPVAKLCADYTYDGGHKAIDDALAKHDIDGIICANDAMALGALSAARDTHDKRIPEDVCVTGFDDISMAEWPCFDLTTIRNPIDECVDHIVDLLESRLSDPSRDDQIRLIDPPLINRGSA